MSGDSERKKLIVICDDNAALNSLMQHLLKTKGFSVRGALDGEEGLELIRASRPDLLLLDLAMPARDGLGVLQSLNSSGEKKPYTIVITGQEAAARDKAAALGSNEVWRKPFNAAVLIARIEALISEGAI
jgi:two-component system phosphate regulon response regulator PhoB